jgi:radical SAM superfamily enzyme YgiQ (UPF0313 family)
MRIKLIAPEVRTNFSGWIKRLFVFPRLALPILASSTPKEHDVSIHDESFGQIDLNEPADIIGISVITAAAKRAYELGDFYRKKGSKVIFGGMHPSVLPQEALKHSDAVVVGEGELVWPEILRDIENGKLKSIYSRPLPNLYSYKFPRRDCFDKCGLLIKTIEASRGCPYNCDFCSVAKFHRNPKFKTRLIENIIEEVEKLGTKYLFFVDDNLVGNKTFARELFQSLTPYKLKWMAQLSIDVAEDQKLLSILQRSGLVGAYIGFDSLNKANLNNQNKKMANYVESVKKIRDKGIAIQGSFIFGFDEDEHSIFDRTLDFLEKTGIELAYFHLLTPYPGTKYFNDLEDQNRIFTYDWDKYDSKHIVFYPTNFSPERLYEEYIRTWREFYSIKSLSRIFGSNRKLFSAVYNLANIVSKAHIENKPGINQPIRS